MAESRRIQSIERAFDVIEEVVNHKEGIGLSKLSRKVNLCLNTTSSIVRTLVSLGYLSQLLPGGFYYTGHMLAKLAVRTFSNYDVRIVAEPIMKKMFLQCNETIHLGILTQHEATDIDVIESSQSVRVAIQVGHAMPLHCSALGKVLIAWMNKDEVLKLLNVKGLYKYTENTITSIEELWEELAKVRKQGYAFNKGESEVGLRCVSAPIRGYKDKNVIAGISISCPKERYSPEKEIELIKLVLDASEMISIQIGNRKI